MAVAAGLNFPAFQSFKIEKQHSNSNIGRSTALALLKTAERLSDKIR
jgi:hypothetical protein